jgi:hypothetical protein
LRTLFLFVTETKVQQELHTCQVFFRKYFSGEENEIGGCAARLDFTGNSELM